MHTINSLAVSKLKTYTHQPTGGRRHIKCIIIPYIHTKNNSVTLHLKGRNVMICKCRKFIIHIMIKNQSILQNSIPSWVEGHQRAFSIPRNCHVIDSVECVYNQSFCYPTQHGLEAINYVWLWTNAMLWRAFSHLCHDFRPQNMNGGYYCRNGQRVSQLFGLSIKITQPWYT